MKLDGPTSVARVGERQHKHRRLAGNRQHPPRGRDPLLGGVTPFLLALRQPCALIGVLLLSVDLPLWAQGVAPAASPTVPPAAAPVTPPAAAMPEAASRLMDSYELCEIGRLGQHELSFLTVFILVGCFIFFLQIDRRLIRHGWEIRKALSEPTNLSYVSTDASGKPLLNEKGEPVTIRVMEASVSRLIALAGLIMLILFYFGFGIISIYHFGRTCEMPGDINNVTAFLYAGLTFFAPYIATKFSEIFAPGARRLPLPGVHGNTPWAANGQRGLAQPQYQPQPESQTQPQPESQAQYQPQLQLQNRPQQDISSPSAPVPAANLEPSESPSTAWMAGPPNGHGDARGLAMAPPSAAPSAAPGAAAPANPVEPVLPHSPAVSAVRAPAAVSAQRVTAAPAPPPPTSSHSNGLQLIKEFEGFRNQAYPDPASGGDPWTIGYGFTHVNGRAVVPGQTISQADADHLLATMVEDCAHTLSGRIPFWKDMSDKQQSALISFAWNLGEGFYGDEVNFHTITSCLRNRDWGKVGDALLLYCMPGTAVHQGLLRRRQAEANLWRQGMVSGTPAPPAQAVASAAHAAPRAPAAVEKSTGTPSRPLAAGAETVATTAVATAVAAPTASAHPNPLKVVYYDQMLMDDGKGWRDCFSASCAMLACYWGKVNAKDANAYNHIRQKYGDTTDSNAQVQALRSLGLNAQFRQDGTPESLKAEIDAGRPVAVGWLHHGPVGAPSGGGHWTVVIGYDDTGFWMNDPYGSCDLVGGGYPGGGNPQDQLGKGEHYSFKNWLPRWMPGGDHGWFLSCRP